MGEYRKAKRDFKREKKHRRVELDERFGDYMGSAKRSIRNGEGNWEENLVSARQPIQNFYTLSEKLSTTVTAERPQGLASQYGATDAFDLVAAAELKVQSKIEKTNLYIQQTTTEGKKLVKEGKTSLAKQYAKDVKTAQKDLDRQEHERFEVRRVGRLLQRYNAQNEPDERSLNNIYTELKGIVEGILGQVQEDTFGGLRNAMNGADYTQSIEERANEWRNPDSVSLDEEAEAIYETWGQESNQESARIAAVKRRKDDLDDMLSAAGGLKGDPRFP